MSLFFLVGSSFPALSYRRFLLNILLLGGERQGCNLAIWSHKHFSWYAPFTHYLSLLECSHAL